jgi:phosphoserine phosphatase RsbU/P
MASRLFPSRVRNRVALDFYGESQMSDRLGGDFFDFMPLGPNGLVIAIGHVSGQSAAAAALLIPGLRAFLRTRLPADGDLRRGVRDLNRTICDTSPDSFYATLFCAAMDPERHELRYVNAGHEPALLVRAGGERVCRLENTGTVVGLTTAASYGVRTIALEAGDVLAAFTEGVVEAANPAGQVFAASGVLEVLRAHPGARSNELVGCLVDAVRQFADRARPAGDRTVAAVRFNKTLAEPLLEDEAEEAFAAA